MSGLGASRTEQGTTGQSGPAERVTHTNSMAASPIPMLQLGTAIHAAKRHSLCLCVYAEHRGRGGCRRAWRHHLLRGLGMQGTLGLEHEPRPKGVKGSGSPLLPLSQYVHPPWALEGFAMNRAGTVFFILLLGHPHLLEGVQGGEDGAAVKTERQQSLVPVGWASCHPRVLRTPSLLLGKEIHPFPPASAKPWSSLSRSPSA